MIDISEQVLPLSFMLLSMIVAFSWAPLLIKYLYKFKIVRLIDNDFSGIIESRRLKRGIPIMGGLLVVLTVSFITLIFNFDGEVKIPLLVFLLSAALGGLDDILNIYGRERPVRSIRRTMKLIRVHKSFAQRIFLVVTFPWQAYKRLFFLIGSNPGKGIQAHEKIIIQTIAGVAVAWWLCFRLGWHSIWLPFGYELNLGIFMPIFIVFVVVGLANAVNITDGMDGLSSGSLIISFLAYLLIAIILKDSVIAFLCATVVGALIAYLYFNIPPARFQMGDVGSLALGTLLATVAFVLDRAILIPIIGGVFFVEILTIIIQGISRRILGRRIFKMAPLHHHFEIMEWSEEKIVMRFWLFSMIFAIIGIWLSLA